MMKKLPPRKKAGFTLTEVLVAIIIILLVTAVIMTGLPTAQRAYVDVVDAGNAETLLSTSITVLQDLLSTTPEAKVDGEGNVIYFINSNTGFWTKLENSDEGILLSEYPGTIEGLGTPRSRLIVSKAAATAPLKTVFSKITYSNGVFTITGLKVMRGTDEMSSVETYKLRAIGSVTVNS